MHRTAPYVGLIRTGSACLCADDPAIAQNWLQTQHQMLAHYHPATQQWLSAEQRATILLDFLLDDRYTALWALRGGEGAADTLPYLQRQAAAIQRAKPKLLLGLSDVTAFLNYFNQYFHWPVVHCAGAVQAARGIVDDESIQLTISLLRDRNTPYRLTHLTPLNDAAKKTGHLSALLCGGNLSVLAISIQDIWQIQCAHKILVIEDLNEAAYKVARYLNYFKRIKLLDECAAIIFGDFLFASNLAQTNLAQIQAITHTLERFAHSCPFPVLQTRDFGHGQRCLPLPFFRTAQLQLADNPSLAFCEE